jgi:hypothetical protein
MSRVNLFWIGIVALLIIIGMAAGLLSHRGAPRQLQTPAVLVSSTRIAPTSAVEASKSLVKELQVPATIPADAEKAALAESPVLDRDFAAAAARPYVEAYFRQHPWLKIPRLDWNSFQAVYFASPGNASTKGYLGVFFSRNGVSAAAFTCFNVEDDAQDHLQPVIWGQVPDVTVAIEKLRHNTEEGNGCMAHVLWD